MLPVMKAARFMSQRLVLNVLPQVRLSSSSHEISEERLAGFNSAREKRRSLSAAWNREVLPLIAMINGRSSGYCCSSASATSKPVNGGISKSRSTTSGR